MTAGADLDLPPGWVPISDLTEQASLEAELRREIVSEHVLANERVTAIARWLTRDDFLFTLDGGRVASVHLTWSVEKSPLWPATIVHDSFDEWRRVPDEDR
jgi:hypothetical protein